MNRSNIGQKHIARSVYRSHEWMSVSSLCCIFRNPGWPTLQSSGAVSLPFLLLGVDHVSVVKVLHSNNNSICFGKWIRWLITMFCLPLWFCFITVVDHSHESKKKQKQKPKRGQGYLQVTQVFLGIKFSGPVSKNGHIIWKNGHNLEPWFKEGGPGLGESANRTTNCQAKWVN